MKSKWVVSLSDGTVVPENKVSELVVNSDRSGWLRVVDYCREKNTTITHLKGIVNGIEYHLPTYNAVGRFSNDGDAQSFWAARRFMRMMGLFAGNSDETWLDLSYSDGHFRHHLLVNEKTNGCWTSITKLDEGLSKSISDIVGEW